MYLNQYLNLNLILHWSLALSYQLITSKYINVSLKKGLWKYGRIFLLEWPVFNTAEERGLCRTVTPICLTDLIGAPVPGGLNGESKHKARPRQVPCNRIPEKMEGVWPRLVAAGVKASSVSRDGYHVQIVEFFVASHFSKS